MQESARYVKLVEWSDEDQCYVGSAPGLLLGGCHGRRLPPPTAGRDFANKLQPVA
jgi:hypothetical protein